VLLNGRPVLNYPERPTRRHPHRFWLYYFDRLAVRRYTLWLSLAASERA
jgi:hypothetical protein